MENHGKPWKITKKWPGDGPFMAGNGPLLAGDGPLLAGDDHN